jgi:crossover junction endodeoxyribonuclease RusA
MTKIDLPWPPKELSCNGGHGHWRPRAEATRRYRADAFWAANEAGVGEWPKCALVFTYHPPDRRRRDVQNMPSMMKAAIDGIADAMGCDDRDFRPRFPDRFAEPVTGGLVVVEVLR